jgi:hypothetical protein
MEARRIVLDCKLCGECPAVEFIEHGVSIGERQNTVHLTFAQWNDLVARVRAGELVEVAVRRFASPPGMQLT